MSLATEYNQENLVEITSLEYHFLEEQIKKCAFLSFTKDDSYQGNQKATIRYIDKPRKFLTVNHYTSKDGGGIKPSYKADKDLFEAYKIKNKK
jgi:hypothetical protein